MIKLKNLTRVDTEKILVANSNIINKLKVEKNLNVILEELSFLFKTKEFNEETLEETKELLQLHINGDNNLKESILTIILRHYQYNISCLVYELVEDSEYKYTTEDELHNISDSPSCYFDELLTESDQQFFRECILECMNVNEKRFKS